MLYLGIDQHRKQLTVNLRNEAGRRDPQRQVSTEWKRVRAFWAEIRTMAGGRRVRRDSGGLRLQRLAAEAAQGIRLPRNVPRPAREAVEEEDRPPRRQCPGRDPVGQPAAAAGGQEGAGRACHPPPSAEDAEGRQLTAIAQASGPAPHADHQPDQASLAETQSGAGVPHEGDRHHQGEEVAGPVSPWVRSTGWRWTSSWRSGSCGRSRSHALEAEIRKRQEEEQDGGDPGHDSRLCGPTAAWPWPRGSATSSDFRGPGAWRTIGA